MQNSLEYYLMILKENDQKRDEIKTFKTFVAQQIRAFTDKPRLDVNEQKFLNQLKCDYKKLIVFKNKVDEVRQVLYN